MPTVTNYSTLTQAIADYTHRSDLTTGGSPLSDYFIQGALEQIQQDIPDENFGNFIRPMEVGYGPVTIAGGVAPVPTDWLGAKIMTVSDGNSDTWPLLMKAASWLYSTYPVRQPSGLPAYIARDVMPPVTLTGVISAVTNLAATAVSGVLQRGIILSGAGIPTSPAGAITVVSQTSGTTGGNGTYVVANPQSLAIGSEAMTGGGEVFVFGPYPDSNYQIGGTYYGAIPSISSGSPTNWLTTKAPALLLAACMVEAGRFIVNQALVDLWTPKYEEKLKALVDMDKAERWASGTMAIEIA